MVFSGVVNRELKQRRRRRKKAIGLGYQNDNFAGASRLFVYFLAVVARRHETC